MVYTRTTTGTIFSADVWISGGQMFFSIQTWCIPLGAFASKTDINVQVCRDILIKNELPSSVSIFRSLDLITSSLALFTSSV